MSLLNTEIQSEKDDQLYWWSGLSQPLHTLLETCQYSEDDQLNHMRLFHQYIVPSLGPRPVNGGPYYGAWLTYNGSSLEYSLNWKEKGPPGLETIRFTIEPCSRAAGTPADPLNQDAAPKLLRNLARVSPGIDLARYELFHAETRVPSDAADAIRSKNPPGAPLTGNWVAFDLERRGAGATAKAYFLPHMKAVLTGLPPQTIVFDAMRKCNGKYGSYDGSIQLLDSYLESFAARGAEAPMVVMLSNDCVPDGPSCRNKVYVQGAVGSLAHARDMFSLGGRLTGPLAREGLEAVSELWRHLFGFSSRAEADAGANTVVWEDGRKFLCVYEMRPTPPGEPVADMEVKLHLPGWRLGQTDAQLAQRLAAWFEKHGHASLAARYQTDLAATL